MIQVNELRIGNYVMTGNIKSIVLEIFASGITHDSKNGNIVAGHCGWSHINPIPLTEEWLLKFGFTKEDNGWHKKDICNDFSALYWERLAGLDLSVNKRSMHLANIKYVHQLQNLYFSLTGEELKIQQ